MTFVLLVLIQFYKAYSYRSDRNSILRRPFSNRWLNLAVLWELGLLGLVIYVPFLQRAFGTFTFGWADWGIVATAAFSIVPWVEGVKWVQRRGYNSGQSARASRSPSRWRRGRRRHSGARISTELSRSRSNAASSAAPVPRSRISRLHSALKKNERASRLDDPITET